MTRELVHRRAISEVFVLTTEQVAEHRYILDAQWPRRHFYFAVDRGELDLVLVAETLRQATILIAHHHYDVPMNFAFLMGRLEVHLIASRLDDAAVPPDVSIDVTVDGIRTGSQGVVALRTSLEFSVNGVPIAAGIGELQVLDPRIYGRMRPHARRSDDRALTATLVPPAVRERGVGIHSFSRNEPAAPGEAAWRLELDVSHPVLFDHPLDHVPGMLVIESVRQVVRAVLGDPAAALTAFDGRFTRFLDLDGSTEVALVTRDADGALRLEARQGGLVAATIVARGESATA